MRRDRRRAVELRDPRARLRSRRPGREPARMQIRVGGAAIGGEIDVPRPRRRARRSTRCDARSSPRAPTRCASSSPTTTTSRRTTAISTSTGSSSTDRSTRRRRRRRSRRCARSAIPPSTAASRVCASGSSPSRARAWRRPPTHRPRSTRWSALADDASRRRRGLRRGARRRDARGADVAALPVPRRARSAPALGRESHPLSDHELATRLSYFLWSSMPDATLDALADAGTLDMPATLAAQVHRMVLRPEGARLRRLLRRPVARHARARRREPGLRLLPELGRRAEGGDARGDAARTCSGVPADADRLPRLLRRELHAT